MSTATKAVHTPGAMRAATTILGRFGKVHPEWAETCAEIINRETAAPEMLEALERICDEAESWHTMHGHQDEVAAVQCDTICALIPKMRAAIQKAKGGQ